MLCAHFITFSLSFTSYLFVSSVICTLVKCIAIDEIVLVIDNCSRILWLYLFLSFFFILFLYTCILYSLCIIFFLIGKIVAQHIIERTLDCVTMYTSNCTVALRLFSIFFLSFLKWRLEKRKHRPSNTMCVCSNIFLMTANNSEEKQRHLPIYLFTVYIK